MVKDSGMPDGVGSKVIDWFTIDLNNDGGHQRLEPQVFQGRFRIAEIELSFEVICTDNYSLPNCMSCDPGTSDLCTQRGPGEQCYNRSIITEIRPHSQDYTPTWTKWRYYRCSSDISLGRALSDFIVDVRSDGTTGTIAGGVVGGLVGVVLIAVIVIVIVIIVKNKQESSQCDGIGLLYNNNIITCDLHFHWLISLIA